MEAKALLPSLSASSQGWEAEDSNPELLVGQRPGDGGELLGSGEVGPGCPELRRSVTPGSPGAPLLLPHLHHEEAQEAPHRPSCFNIQKPLSTW